jgi:hypothetical protein
MMKLGIIGDGIAARSLLHFLVPQLPPSVEILQFSHDDFAPPCSLCSTAVVAKRGVQLGVSPLGDEIYHCHEFQSQYLVQNKAHGVDHAFHYQLWSVNHEQRKYFLKRYSALKETVPDNLPLTIKQGFEGSAEAAFIFYPEQYLNWLVSKLSFNHHKEMIIEVTQNKSAFILKSQSGQEFIVDALVNASGAMGVVSQIYGKDTKGLHSKVVGGCYWEGQCDLGDSSWSMTVNGINMVYRSQSKVLQVGTYSQESSSLVCENELELRSMFQAMQDYFPKQLPDFEEGDIFMGLRQKGPKRQSFYGKIDCELPLYGLHSFYKNGYTLALHQAKQLAETLLLDVGS